MERPDRGTVSYQDSGGFLGTEPGPAAPPYPGAPCVAEFSTLRFLKNVAYGLKIRGITRAEIEERVNDALMAVGLSHKKWQRALELSSGETKRLGIARALVINPEVFMLDEPTANIDPANTAIIEDIILAYKTRAASHHPHDHPRSGAGRALG